MSIAARLVRHLQRLPHPSHTAGVKHQSLRRHVPTRVGAVVMVSASQAAGKQGHLPALFLAHGGGPLPLLGHPSHASLNNHWVSLSKEMAALKPDIKAILLVSAHWEEAAPTVTTYSSPPPLTYDYYGFPDEAYSIKYPAAGDPELAERILQLLKAAGIEGAKEGKRGLDHGAFVPLKALFPEADVPVVVLSLVHTLDPEAHLAVGRALAPLREEGVLIIGSGMSFHNMSFLRGGGNSAARAAQAQEFSQYLKDAVTSEPEQQQQRLAGWQEAPHARYCHPREEHLIPLHVVAGASHCRPATVIFDDTLMGAPCTSFQYA